MEYVIDSAEMKKCDQVTIDKIGIPSLVLVERAALCAEEELCDSTFNLERVLVICGSGNNGADGLALARLLCVKGIDVSVLFIGDEAKRTAENRAEAEILRKHGINIMGDADFDSYTAIVDALFGIGLSKAVDGRYKEVIEQMNHSKALVLSLDIPSGISADTGRVMGIAVRAAKTVTFAYKKIGLTLYPSAEYAGIVKVKDIGVTELGFEDTLPKVCSHTHEDLKAIPKRKPYSNKGTFGKVLIIGGSVNMCGAAYFSAKAAYRTGAGLVKVYTPDENRVVLQSTIPEAVLSTYDRKRIDYEAMRDNLSWADIIVIGPGMGVEGDSREILKFVMSSAKVPLVIDADAVNLLAKEPELLDEHRQEIIITPHLGEMSRLIGKDIEEIADNLIAEATELARRYRVICVLKDSRTVTTDGGSRIYLNQSGNSGMATGGSGDVLTGIIAGLAAQGGELFESASLGVYIHGLAGDAASERHGAYGVTANEIIDGINDIVR